MRIALLVLLIALCALAVGRFLFIASRHQFNRIHSSRGRVLVVLSWVLVIGSVLVMSELSGWYRLISGAAFVAGIILGLYTYKKYADQ